MSAAAQRYVPVPDGAGGFRHELRLVSDLPQPRPRRRQPRTLDPIKANPDSSAQSLRQFIERIERMQQEIADAQADLADIFSEAKGQGFTPSIMRLIIARRKKEKHLRDEEDALLEAYNAALGLD